MKVASQTDIIALVQSDDWMMDVLRAAQTLDLPDWWIGAGFLRNRVWDAMQGNPPSLVRDVDLVYFEPADVEPETDWSYDEQLKAEFPFAEWEVRNQARMHYKNNFPPFSSTADGIAHWTETATAVAVKLTGNTIELLFRYGTDDLLNMIARPTPYMNTPELLDLFHRRVEEKKWCERWPNLRVEDTAPKVSA